MSNEKYDWLKRAGFSPEFADKIAHHDRLAENVGLTEALVEKTLDRVTKHARVGRRRSVLEFLRDTFRPGPVILSGALIVTVAALISSWVTRIHFQRRLETEIARQNAVLKDLEKQVWMSCDDNSCDRKVVKSSLMGMHAVMSDLAVTAEAKHSSKRF